jgi:NAD(P)-dependent dehydrogenase (short-subunit alcohol dehydrogenase family)/acyl carrier protein
MGLLKTAPYELAWLSTRHIDFSFYKTEKELIAQTNALVDEIVDNSHDDEVVYRHGLRYGWHLLPKNFTEDNFCSCPIRTGGVMVLTGGLGGLGSILAQFLIKRFDARLILIGRSELPERGRWPDLIRQGGKLSERITRYLEIEALDGEFVYSVADVSNLDDLLRVVNSAEQRWNKPLNGVFHLAVGGDIGTHSIIDDSINSYEQMFTAKVYGSLALAKLVSQRDNAFMASFGSVIGLFGEAGYAAYAAAHTFLNQLTHYFNHKMPGRFYQLDWSAWENNPAFAIDYFKTIGYSLVTAQVGMDCLLAGLCRKQANLIIGLDADKWSIRKHLAFESQPLLKLVCCFTANKKNTDIESLLKTISIYDRFQMQSQCDFLQLEHLPETTDGKIDILALQTMIDNQITEEDDLPSSALEKQIAAFWSDVLDVNEPGKHSNFFQLGGNSLNGMQLISRLNQAFNIHLEMRDLFDAFTISDMAVLIENKPAQFEQKKGQTDSDLEFDQIESLNAHELLANIDQLSEEKVASLLAKMQKEAEA